MDPEESLDRLLRDLRSRREGLTDREAARRLAVSGPNELVRKRGRTWPRQLGRQLVHPLALLLWAAAALAWVGGTPPLAVAIAAVVVLNAAFAFVQERHAERAVEALTEYLPPHATVRRDGQVRAVDARDLVPGDVIVVAEGDRVSADARLLTGSVEMDISTLTGESQPVLRTPLPGDHRVPLLEARDIVFSGTSCTEGEATAVVFATGMATELGRIAAMSQHTEDPESPLETQVKRVAWLIAAVALTMGVGFIPLGTLLTGLSFSDSVSFAIGLLVANVPEGLLPTITLALAIGVRVLAREGALVKRISAVETLGSTDVICTDKTGTLTLNSMRVVRTWTATGERDQAAGGPAAGEDGGDPLVRRLATAGTACNNARWDPADPERRSGDPTELALHYLAGALGVAVESEHPCRRAQFHFDPALRRMSTVDEQPGGRTGDLVLRCKGAPEEVLPRCTRIAGPADGAGDGVGNVADVPLTAARRDEVAARTERWARQGLRVLALAERRVPVAELEGLDREVAESELTLLGLVAMVDPPRPEVRDAVVRCHTAGIRLLVVTGDHGLTARAIARQVGIGSDDTRVVNGPDLDLMSEADLDALLAGHDELVFARSSPEAKLRIADALQSQGHVVAMTGDGVNDAPALHKAAIGVAMGRSGTDVAREAATMVLTDDNFATIVSAVQAGRRVYDNVRKFILYIFAHATPEVVPFLIYAAAGGRIPLPLTVMQILAIDLGTETLPALALGREPAESGLMQRPPRRRGQNVIDATMLGRAWGLMGGTTTLLVLLAFGVTLVEGGWGPGDDVAHGPLHDVWVQATTMSFLVIVACQIGTAVASRTEHASLARTGLLTNPMLLWGIAFEVVFAACVVLVPWLQPVFGTTVPQWWQVAMLLPMPVLVWGVDEAWRWRRRAHPSG